MYRTHKRRPEFKAPRRLQCLRSTGSVPSDRRSGDDYKGAVVLLASLPQARELLADRGYDADWFRAALSHKGITPCIPGRRSRKTPVAYDKELYKQRHKIEIMFGRLKDWRRIATRYDRCAHTFFSAICITAIVIFYI